MPGFYFDTSALAKRYHRESGSECVDSLFSLTDNRIVISRLSTVEVVSAMAMKVRTGVIDAKAFESARLGFNSDIKKRTITIARTLVVHFRAAQSLIVNFALQSRLRTLDAIQLATASSLIDAGHVDTFVTSDTALIEIATKLGIATLDPTVSP